MNIYIEDIFFLDIIISILSVFLFIKLLKIKRNYSAIFCAINIAFFSLFLPKLFICKLSYISLILLPFIPIFFNAKNIAILLNRQLLFISIVSIFYLCASIVFFVTTIFNFGSFVLIAFSMICLVYFIVEKIYNNIFNCLIIKNTNKTICINGKLSNAIIDTGNRIVYRGEEVVVLDNNYDVKFSNKTIEVNTINSQKSYNIGFIREIICSGKYFYNVPAIVETKNNKVILPSKYS